MRGNVLKNLTLSFITIILFLFISNFGMNAQDFYIRSLKCYQGDQQTSFPLIDLNDQSRNSLTIEFDLLSSTLPDFKILFKFCDSDWQPYDNAFLSNPGYNTEFNLYYYRLPVGVNGATFHYKGNFPNQNVTFPFSGKWKYFIVDTHNENQVFAEGKFYVVNTKINLKVGLRQERLEGAIPDEPSLGRRISIRTEIILPDSMFQSQLKKIEIIENRKINMPVVVDRITRSLDRFYEWNGSNKFIFVARQLLPGNEYRQTDFRNVNLFPLGTINAQHTGVETSDFFKRRFNDFNGGSELSYFKERNSEYLNVNFKLRSPEEIKSPIFLVGSFTDWKVLPEYEMFDDNGLMNITVQLKRGAYDYQYVTGDIANGEIKNINWNILEGNFFETKNEYHIFVFYESTEKGGYDQIIAYKKIISGETWEK